MLATLLALTLVVGLSCIGWVGSFEVRGHSTQRITGRRWLIGNIWGAASTSPSPALATEHEALVVWSNASFTELAILNDLYAGEHFSALMSKYLPLDMVNNEGKPGEKANTKTDFSFDKGTSRTADVLAEFLYLNSSYELPLNIFRRNIALRANRVLHPARNAQIFSALINTMLTAELWREVRGAVEYIGLTPATYIEVDSISGNVVIDFNRTCTYVCRRMLELDLDRMAWVIEGRDAASEPSTPKSRGEAVQEWLYTQVHRSDLGFRACDMLMAVGRLAVREAVDRVHEMKGTSAVVEVNLCLDDLFARAGMPMDEEFLERFLNVLSTDIRELLPKHVARYYSGAATSRSVAFTFTMARQSMFETQSSPRNVTVLL